VIKVYQLLAHDRCFSPGTLASSTTKTGRYDIAEILLKVAFSTINQSIITHPPPTPPKKNWKTPQDICLTMLVDMNEKI
jgi:hypothetical protein